jgi:hypothetical protein
LIAAQKFHRAARLTLNPKEQRNEPENHQPNAGIVCRFALRAVRDHSSYGAAR